MRTICLYFEIHQIIHLKRYRFFDIGTDHYYYDDYDDGYYGGNYHDDDYHDSSRPDWFVGVGAGWRLENRRT